MATSAGFLSGHHASACQRLPDEPVVNAQGALDDVSPFGAGQLSHLVDECQLGRSEDGLNSGHTRISSFSDLILLLLGAPWPIYSVGHPLRSPIELGRQ